MDTRTFESIKAKIDLLKQKKAKAEGAIENILAEWQKVYHFDTLEDAEKRLKEIDDETTLLEGKLETLYTELNGLTNWSLL